MRLRYLYYKEFKINNNFNNNKIFKSLIDKKEEQSSRSN